nr:hypothetical protein [Phreatobacter sp.]
MGFVLQGSNQFGHFAAVATRHVGMKQHGRVLRRGQQRAQFGLARRNTIGFFTQGRRDDPLHHDVDQPLLTPRQSFEFRPIAADRGVMLHAQAVDVRRVFLAERRDQLLVHEIVLDDFKHGVFKRILSDRALVRAQRLALVSRRRASEMA